MFSPRAIEIAQIEVNAHSTELQKRLFNGHAGTVILSIGFFDCRDDGGQCGYGLCAQAVAFHDPVFKGARTLLSGWSRHYFFENSADYRLLRMQHWINALTRLDCERLLSDFCTYFQVKPTLSGEKSLRAVSFKNK